MAKQKPKPKAPQPSRMEGDATEGDAWAAAMGSAKPAQSGAPLTDEEKAMVNTLMLGAALKGDMEMVDLLKELAANPDQLRQRLADFDPDA